MGQGLEGHRAVQVHAGADGDQVDVPLGSEHAVQRGVDPGPVGGEVVQQVAKALGMDLHHRRDLDPPLVPQRPGKADIVRRIAAQANAGDAMLHRVPPVQVKSINPRAHTLPGPVMQMRTSAQTACGGATAANVSWAQSLSPEKG